MAKSLEEGFSTFLGWLKPLDSEHDKAVSHRGSVKSCFENNFKCYEFFETGSFGNRTGVRHHSDTDYFAVCPIDELSVNSGTVLREARQALEKTFWATGNISVCTPAVRIPFGQYVSETIEVTPARYNGMVNTPVGNKPYYDIPDFDGGWMQSSPRAHNAYVNQHNDRLYGKLKPLIQLVKAWKFYNSVPITSFYLELRVTKYAEKETAIVYDIDLHHFIKYLYDNDLPSIQDPMGISGYVRACSTDAKKAEALSKLSTAYSRACKAYEERNDNIDQSFYWWDLFFNYKFPAR